MPDGDGVVPVPRGRHALYKPAELSLSTSNDMLDCSDVLQRNPAPLTHCNATPIIDLSIYITSHILSEVPNSACYIWQESWCQQFDA